MIKKQGLPPGIAHNPDPTFSQVVANIRREEKAAAAKAQQEKQGEKDVTSVWHAETHEEKAASANICQKETHDEPAEHAQRKDKSRRKAKRVANGMILTAENAKFQVVGTITLKDEDGNLFSVLKDDAGNLFDVENGGR